VAAAVVALVVSVAGAMKYGMAEGGRRQRDMAVGLHRRGRTGIRGDETTVLKPAAATGAQSHAAPVTSVRTYDDLEVKPHRPPTRE
jgi:hypothetical protein